MKMLSFDNAVLWCCLIGNKRKRGPGWLTVQLFNKREKERERDFWLIRFCHCYYSQKVAKGEKNKFVESVFIGQKSIKNDFSFFKSYYVQSQTAEASFWIPTYTRKKLSPANQIHKYTIKNWHTHVPTCTV